MTEINLTGTALVRHEMMSIHVHRNDDQTDYTVTLHSLEGMVSHSAIRAGGCRISYCPRLNLTTGYTGR